MAKNAKKPPVHNGKPITAFFARSSVAPSSQDASRSTGKQSPRKAPMSVESENAGQAVTTPESSNLNSSSKSPIKPSAAGDPLRASSSSPRRSERNHTSSLMPPFSASLKRLRSPSLLESTGDPVNMASSDRNVSPGRRKPKCDRDSRMENKGNNIYVNSTPNPKGKKRARLSTVEDSTLSEISDLVPSSQSDEEELFISKDATNSQKPSADVEVSRSTSRSLSPEKDTDKARMEIDIDHDLSDDLKPSTSTSSTDGDMSVGQESQSSDRMMTPPPSDLPSIPPTPIALDPASKTAQIIAEIKARAYAQVTSSPEVVPLELDEQEDSSSDEETFLPILPQPRTVPSTSRLDNPINNSDAAQRSSRYSLRNRSSSPTNGSRASGRSGRIQAKSTSQAITNRKTQGKKIPDPFAALLREKRSAQKRGNGDDAFTRAEIRTHNLGKNGLLDEMEEDEDEVTNGQNDEDIAKALVENPDLFDEDVINIDIPEGSKAKETEKSVEDDDRKTLFGPKSGRAILDILKQDKALKRHDESSQKTSGIHFWLSSPTMSSVSLTAKDVSLYRLFGSSVLIRLFNTCLQRNNFARAATLLDTNFINSLEVCDRASVASDLYDLIFSFPSAPDVLRAAAVNALEEFWHSNEEPLANGILFSRILATVEALGADASIVSEHKSTKLDVEQYQDITTFSRELVLSQLLVLIAACARSKRLQTDDIPDIILMLLLMGMDETISSNLSRDITLAVDLVCNCIPQEGSNISEIEIHLISKILQCAQPYEPINKSRMVLLLSGGSSTTRRIANFVAYCIITDKESPEQESYSDTPPLPEVIDQLAPYSRSSALPPGKFALHQNTDYVDLGFYITILGVTVSNLRNYVVLERKASAARNAAALTGGSPRKVTEKPKTDLQLLHAGLETLHSNILDTRATHLERSRTKAAIKGLAMNIHYQREHWVKNGSEARSKTLAEYFQKKTKS